MREQVPAQPILPTSNTIPFPGSSTSDGASNLTPSPPSTSTTDVNNSVTTTDLSTTTTPTATVANPDTPSIEIILQIYKRKMLGRQAARLPAFHRGRISTVAEGNYNMHMHMVPQTEFVTPLEVGQFGPLQEFICRYFSVFVRSVDSIRNFDPKKL